MGAIGLRRIVRPFAPLITTIQILQMVGGIAVTITAARLVKLKYYLIFSLLILYL